MSAQKKARIRQAIKETEAILANAGAYLERFQDKGLVVVYEEHLRKLKKLL